jgi:hypothetical protein
VATATDGYQELMGVGKIDGMDNVGGTSTAGDESGSVVDHRVPNDAGGFIAIVARTEQFTAQAPLELFDDCFLKDGGRACCRGNS